MKLYEIIERDIDPIVREWVEFARTKLPTADAPSPEALADHARVLLLSFAADLKQAQVHADRHQKSRGNLPQNSPAITRIARDHASDRFVQGFTLDQVVAEFRALRASVIRRWTKQLANGGLEAIDDLTRFGEAVDQALTESISRYAEKLERSRGLLLGVLGHDLRNPLGVVQLAGYHLLHSEGLTEAQTTSAARILTSTERMRQMVDDLLDFTQTASGRLLPMAPIQVDIGDLVQKVVGEIQALNPQSIINLDCADSLPAHWDPARIQQLLSNLIANAVQHGKPGTPVTVKVRCDCEVVTIDVHNEGPSIPADERKSLFEPLRQSTKPGGQRRSQSSSGLGLGLYIARQIAVAHGGDLELAPAGDGITFTVQLPGSLKKSG